MKERLLNIFSLIISIMALVVVLLRVAPYEFDYLMFLCASLGVIVTFLVGFQIASAIEVKYKLKEMREFYNILKSEIQLDRFENYYHLAQFSHNDKNAYRYIYFGLKVIDSRIDYDNTDICSSMMEAMIQTTNNGLVLTRGEQSELMCLFNKNIKIRFVKDSNILENRILDAEIVEKSFYENYS